jgi:hypothetical protein
VALQDLPRSGASRTGLVLRNPFPEPRTTRLGIVKPRGWEVASDEFVEDRPFRMKAGEERPIVIDVKGPPWYRSGTVEIRQEFLNGSRFETIGGFQIEFDRRHQTRIDD